MRNIKYILINDSKPQSPRGKSSNICIDNLGHHYVINRRSSECNPSSLGDCRVASEVGNANSAGAVLKLIDVCQPGHLELGTRNMEPREVERLNACSIGIKYNGSLTDPKLRPLLIDLLLDLREHFPDAKILAKDEYDRWQIKVREDMNQLRRELSDYQ